ARRAVDDLQHFGRGALLLLCFFQFAGEHAELRLQLGDGWSSGRDFARFGPAHMPTFGRLSASTTLRHLLPSGGHDEAQSYANLWFCATRGSRFQVKMRSGVRTKHGRENAAAWLQKSAGDC